MRLIDADVIANAPTVDAAIVKHGRWLKHGYSCPCSVCGFDFGWSNTPMELQLVFMKYCPNCGAKMDDGKRKDGADDETV